MKLSKLILVGLFGFSANAMAGEKLVSSITRSTGGQSVKVILDEKALSVTLDLSAQGHKILVRSLSYTTVSGAKKAIALSQVIKLNPQVVGDSKGLFLLPNTVPARLKLSDVDPAVSVLIQAESYGGLATLKVAHSVTASAGPIAPVPPLPTPPTGEELAEKQCASGIKPATEALAICHQNEDAEILVNSNLKERKHSVDIRYQSALRPLRDCQNSLSQLNDHRNHLSSSIRVARQNLQNANYQINEARRLMHEAARERDGAGYTCTVRGRHQSFQATGATKALALVAALKSCGLNNCGKKDWNSNNWSCAVH
jgi:hypothetical protein